MVVNGGVCDPCSYWSRPSCDVLRFAFDDQILCARKTEVKICRTFNVYFYVETLAWSVTRMIYDILFASNCMHAHTHMIPDHLANSGV